MELNRSSESSFILNFIFFDWCQLDTYVNFPLNIVNYIMGTTLNINIKSWYVYWY
jgi:hypothetical protein